MNPVDAVLGDTFESAAEMGLGIDVVEPGSAHNGVDTTSGLAYSTSGSHRSKVH